MVYNGNHRKIGKVWSSVMKLLYVTQFYKPEAIAAAFRAAEHARLWQQSGADVTVFTGYPNHPKGRIYEGYDPKLLSEENDGGVRLLRSKLTARPNTNLFNRLGNALSFFFFGLWNMLFQSKRIGTDYDAVLGTSGVISAAFLGWIYAAIHKLPFVFELRDITYKQLQATGKSGKSLAVLLAKRMELYLCRKASQVVAVTNGFRDVLIQEGIEAEKIHVITNGADISAALPRSRPEVFTLSYFGTLGISQNIPATFPYAQAVADILPDFTYLLIGEGAQRQQIEKQLETSGHIRLLSGMDSKELEEYYLLTELSVVTLVKSENFQYTLPSKLFQIMGRGIAVLFIGPEGEAARIIRKHNAGLALTGTQEEDLAQLKAFFSRPDWRETLRLMGENGARAVAENYTRKSCAKRYLTLLQKLVKPCQTAKK